MTSSFQVERKRLANGLQVELVRLPGYHSFAAYLCAPVGALSSNVAIDGHRVPTGLAHFLEHRMFDLPRGDAFKYFSELGCDSNAFTSFELTAYYFETASHLLEGLQLLLEMTASLDFPPERVESEKTIILEEWKMTMDRPASRLNYGMLANLFVHSALKEEIVGSPEDIQKTTFEDLRRVFETYYQIDQLRLFVFGDLPKNLMGEIEKLKVNNTQYHHQITQDRPSETDDIAHEYRFTKMDVTIPYLECGMKRLGIRERLSLSKERYEALIEVANNVLFSDAAPLSQKMHEAGLVDFSIAGGIMNVGDVTMINVMTASRHPKAVLSCFQKFLSHLVDYVDFRNLKRAKRNTIGQLLFSLDDLSNFASTYIFAAMRGSDMNQMIEAYQTIDEPLLRAFLKEWESCPQSIHIVSREEPKR